MLQEICKMWLPLNFSEILPKKSATKFQQKFINSSFWGDEPEDNAVLAAWRAKLAVPRAERQEDPGAGGVVVARAAGVLVAHEPEVLGQDGGALVLRVPER